ncbi:MAG: DsbC family protein [Betaproteobacteria bacterium]|jgi:thiol:disulfide interchange protein DsbC|nr:DsbC family protein [Betaproteobacteria bacterium]
MKNPFRVAVLLAAWCMTLSTSAADDGAATIRKAIANKLGGARIEAIQPSPMPGLWEVQLRGSDGPHIIYTDAQAHYILSGSLYDARADRNLTEERLQKLSAINFNELPLDDAVKVKRGNGRRVLAMFSDPHCPACQRFEQELAQIDDVTIYVFMYPVIRPELADHSRAVWCSPDRAKAWLDLALRKQTPTAPTSCDTPIEKTLLLGRKLGVNSTPTLFLVTGERLRGGLPADRLAAALDETAGVRKN